MSGIKNAIKKHKQIIMYLIFGVLTTLVNVVAYWLFSSPLSLNTVISTVLAWAVSVAFAFVTNKLFVFEARGVKRLSWEMLTFFASRLFTGLLDVGIMYLFVDVIGANDILIKIISNLVVIILNFVLSRLIVFARGRK